MGLDIETLLNLNRLRDKKIKGTGVIKKVEICTNPHKVLKETENYTYKTVEVVDGALIDLDNTGIVDEIVRMTFHDEEYVKSTCDYQKVHGRWRRLEGFYLRYKQTDDSHPFNLLFRTCEKAYFNRFKNKNGERKNAEEYFEEDHRSEARLLTFEILCGENEDFNKSFRKAFNLDLKSIDDFKYILIDLELAENVKKYITQAIANEANKVAFRGRNQDYVLEQKKIDGKLESFSKQINTVYLDKKFSENESSDGYSFIKMNEGVYEDSSTISIFIEENVEELKQEDNLYKHILHNIENILTKKQLLYLKSYLRDSDEQYLSTITSDKKTQQAYRSNYKKKIREFIEQYLNRDLYSTKINSKFEFKKSLLVALENILKQSSNKDIFTTLCKYLKEESNNVLEHVLIDVIYSLDYKYYAPIVSYINSNTINDNYIENDFLIVVKAIQKAYNYHARNNNTIYNLNRNDKELVIEKQLKKIMKDNKQGYVSIGKSSTYMSINKLKQFLEGVENVKLTNKKVKEVLKKYRYDIDLNATKKNYVEVYTISLLDHQVKKKETYKKKHRLFDLTIDQSKQIESYIDNNLKLDKLLRTEKHLNGHLRLKDVRIFIEDLLEVKQLSINEIYEVLLQCNYELDLKSGSKQINGVKVHAHKILKLKD